MAISIGLYDSDTQESLVAEKIVDVTLEQSRNDNSRLIYTRAKKGRIVQLQSDGMRIHYFFDSPSGREMITEDSERFGFAPGKLLELAIANAPEN